VAATWREGDVVAVLVNPFYAVNIHWSLSEPHAYALSERRWVAANSVAISRLGARRWLDAMLSALVARHRPDSGRLENLSVGDPFDAITVCRALCQQHPPLVTPELWVHANVRMLDEQRTEDWLRNLLAVLKGAYLTA
jgi:hypothetical protein